MVKHIPIMRVETEDMRVSGKGKDILKKNISKRVVTAFRDKLHLFQGDCGSTYFSLA